MLLGRSIRRLKSRICPSSPDAVTAIQAEASKGIVFDYPYNPKVRSWETTKANRRLRTILAQRAESYGGLLDQIASFLPAFKTIPLTEPKDPSEPHWLNGWIPAIDAMTLYGLLALRNPRTYIEVGSGNSTKFARRAIKDHGLRTRIVSIDPSPRAEIDLICDQVLRMPCEDVGAAFFELITNEDILFIDNSHRSFQNSDVTVFFMEVLPALPEGTIVGLHDIFLPEDYIGGWEERYYNEQYLLGAYIFGGMDGGSILLPNWFISKDPSLKARLDPVWTCADLAGLEDRGGTFWFNR